MTDCIEALNLSIGLDELPKIITQPLANPTGTHAPQCVTPKHSPPDHDATIASLFFSERRLDDEFDASIAKRTFFNDRISVHADCRREC